MSCGIPRRWGRAIQRRLAHGVIGYKAMFLFGVVFILLSVFPLVRIPERTGVKAAVQEPSAAG